ncbi:MAG TPA: outer membrane beta-barrel domain-containing protein [Polyangia bacterium]|nr:outer membrane beta-barrel domain-containing protein [Polyangia bacterium]
MPSAVCWDYDFRALVRATVVLALAYGLTNGIAALAASPLGGPKPTDNLFEDRGGDDSGDSKSDDSKSDGVTPDESKSDESKSDDSKSDDSKSDDVTPDESKFGAPNSAKAGSLDVTSSGADDSASDADNGAADSDEEPESALHGLACLEGDATGGRRKGVQRRDFLKRHRFELSGLGGFYAADALSSTYSYGGALSFYPSEDFGLEALVTRTPMQFRLEEAFTSFDQQTHFQPSIAWQGMLSLLWSPIHAKFKFSETRIIHSDFFAVAGAGRTFDPTVLGLTWEVGGGLKLYFNRYLSFRLDLRDFLLPQEVLGRGRITNNVNVLAGLSLWFG